MSQILLDFISVYICEHLWLQAFLYFFSDFLKKNLLKILQFPGVLLKNLRLRGSGSGVSAVKNPLTQIDVK